jgi:beta-lactamase superfamily II metal-dependent hydrolase
MTRRFILLTLAIGLLLAGCNVTGPNPGPDQPPRPGGALTVAFLDVGQGDATLIRSPNGQIMLIDGGRSVSLASQVIIPQLTAWGAQQVDVLVVTHPDADHISGLVGVLEQYPVKIVALTGQVHPTQIYERLLTDVRNLGLKAIRTRTGTIIPFDEAVKLEVLSPDDQFVNSDDTNDASIVIKLSYGQTSFLFTGDAEFPANQAMLRRGADVRANVLKLGHHGSRTSTDESWLRAVQPQLGIISVGADNSYGHPHREVLDALNRLGIQYIRTDEHGTITVVSDGAQLKVTSTR